MSIFRRHIKLKFISYQLNILLCITKMYLSYFFQFLIFFLTMVFILLTIIFAKEVQGVQTSLPYLLCTFCFYLIQDELFIEIFTKWSFLSKIEKFECREALYGKLVLKIIAIIMATTAHLAVLVSFMNFTS